MKLVTSIVSLSFLLAPIATVTAAVQTKAIEYTVGDTTFVGFLAWDDAAATNESLAPGILVCPEWWGNNDYAQDRAKQLARMGYVALSIDMYGKGDDGKARTTADPKQAGEWAGAVGKDPKVREARVLAGYKALTDQPIVDDSKTAALGYCMGGTVALALARTGADLKAVVAFHASNISSANEADNAKIKGTVLICHGQDDTFVQPGELDKFHEQMKSAKIDYALYAYSGAVHAFTNPKADFYKVPGVAYDKNADTRSWAAMKAVFEEKFGSEFDRGFRQGLKQRLSEGAGTPITALTSEQIAKFDLDTAASELTKRKVHLRLTTDIDPATKARMEKEASELTERIRAVAKELKK